MSNAHDLSFRTWLSPVLERVLEGGTIDRSEALRLLQAMGPDCFDLFAAANRIRHSVHGDKVHLCSIVNAKSGRCSEDCGFCSQSVRFPSDIPEYDLVDNETILSHARRARENASQALGIVAAWRGLKKGRDLDTVLERIRVLAAEEGIHADASLGLIDDPDIPPMLKEAGLHTYNHNLETSRRHFANICETHSYDERIATLKLIKGAGMRTCSGGIFGMGEQHEDRVDLAFELRELDVDVIPLNFLNPMPGTPMEGLPLMEPMECLRTVSMFRFVNPRAHLMVAGGREVSLRHLQPLMFAAGADATMAGSYLTSDGRTGSEDLEMIKQLGLDHGPVAEPAAAPSAGGNARLAVIQPGTSAPSS
jgi:biotin synthase